MALALLFTAWREYRNETLRSEREIVNGLGLPVIAFLPVIPTPSERRHVRNRRLLVVASAMGLVLSIAGVVYLRLTGKL
jgi:hypothetical protein